jgi:hypothetical protein
MYYIILYIILYYIILPYIVLYYGSKIYVAIKDTKTQSAEIKLLKSDSDVQEWVG